MQCKKSLMSPGTGKYTRFVLLTLLQMRSNRNTISNICPQIRIDPLLQMFRFVLQLHHDLFSIKNSRTYLVGQVESFEGIPKHPIIKCLNTTIPGNTSVSNPPCAVVILSGTRIENGAEKNIKITSIQLAWTLPRRYWDKKHKCWIEANFLWTQILLIGL